MAYNPTNPVVVGAATKKDHYDRAFDNTVALYAGAMSISSQAALDFLYASSASQLARLAAGSALQYPRINAAGNGWEFASPAAGTKPYAVTPADVVNTVAQTATASWTVGANEWEDGETIELFVSYLLKNNKGTAGNVETEITIGGTSVQIDGAGRSVANNASEYKRTQVFHMTRVGADVWVYDRGATSNHEVAMIVGNGNTVQVISGPTFSGALACSLDITLNAADASFYWKTQGGTAIKWAAG